jgi:hypothetical protein
LSVFRENKGAKLQNLPTVRTQKKVPVWNNPMPFNLLAHNLIR